MSKEKVVAHVAETAGLTKADASRAYDATFEAIQQLVVNGERHTVPRFGTFSLKQRAARNGRNPRTGETIAIPASESVGFKPTKAA